MIRPDRIARSLQASTLHILVSTFFCILGLPYEDIDHGLAVIRREQFFGMRQQVYIGQVLEELHQLAGVIFLVEAIYEILQAVVGLVA